MQFWVHFQSLCCNLMPCMCSRTKKHKDVLVMRNQSEISCWCGVLSSDWVLANLLSVYQRVTFYLFVALNFFLTTSICLIVAATPLQAKKWIWITTTVGGILLSTSYLRKVRQNKWNRDKSENVRRPKAKTSFPWRLQRHLLTKNKSAENDDLLIESASKKGDLLTEYADKNKIC
jgi:hypothetical protein